MNLWFSFRVEQVSNAQKVRVPIVQSRTSSGTVAISY